jgi:hypothetical protein
VVSQTLLLARTFFRRFFESELMPAGPSQVRLVIWAMALLASPGLLLPGRFAGKYIALQHDRIALTRALLFDRLLFITLTMVALGLVAVVVWEGVFPDRRDTRILSALPLPGYVLIVARLIALAALAGIFSIGITAVPTILYGPLAASYGAAATPLQGALAHFFATTLAGAFVFFSLVALQGVLLNVMGRHTAERLSFALQLVFVTVLLQMLFFLPHIGSVLRTDLRHATANPVLRLIPSIWFLALYDVAGGRPSSGAPEFARLALAATAGVTTASVLLFAVTHGRLCRIALETPPTGTPILRAGRLLSRLVGLFVRTPVERATFAFTLRTLARSRSHRLLLALYLGVALALVISGIVPLVLRDGRAGFMSPGIAVLSAPLVFIFFALTGVRTLLAIPVEPKANWMFRLSEPAARWSAIQGVRKAMASVAVIPFVAIGSGLAFLLWDWATAVLHGAVCLLLGLVLLDVLSLGLYKIPFACSYLPGRSRITTLWPFYLTGFTTFSYSMAGLQIVMLKHPIAFGVFTAVILVARFILMQIRARGLARIEGFRFVEEDPEALFEGFRLSEGLAAQVQPRPLQPRPRP